ncbi:hypothetical protein G740_04706 [Escherichia coli HVH 77 (4-2605759)]|nr:hypothetical protein G740_04706 [Escherichia coli HVH 77 (4-2605759)]
MTILNDNDATSRNQTQKGHATFPEQNDCAQNQNQGQGNAPQRGKGLDKVKQTDHEGAASVDRIQDKPHNRKARINPQPARQQPTKAAQTDRDGNEQKPNNTTDNLKTRHREDKRNDKGTTYQNSKDKNQKDETPEQTTKKKTIKTRTSHSSETEKKIKNALRPIAQTMLKSRRKHKRARKARLRHQNHPTPQKEQAVKTEYSKGHIHNHPGTQRRRVSRNAKAHQHQPSRKSQPHTGKEQNKRPTTQPPLTQKKSHNKHIRQQNIREKHHLFGLCTGDWPATTGCHHSP